MSLIKSGRDGGQRDGGRATSDGMTRNPMSAVIVWPRIRSMDLAAGFLFVCKLMAPYRYRTPYVVADVGERREGKKIIFTVSNLAATIGDSIGMSFFVGLPHGWMCGDFVILLSGTRCSK